MHHVFEVLRAIINRDTWSSLSGIDILVLCHDDNRALNLDGRAYSQLLDPVRTGLEEHGLVVETVAHRWSLLTGGKAWGNPISINRASFVNLVLDWLASLFNGRVGAEIPGRRSIGFWDRILKNSGARAIVVIGAPPELCVASHRVGVPIIEILHGFRFTEIPWGYDSRKVESLPTHIFALDSLSASTFRPLKSLDIKISLVDHPSIHDTAKELQGRNGLDRAPTEIRKDLGDRKVVLVALQWGYCAGESLAGRFSNGLFPDLLVRVINSSAERLKWVLRLHPVQVRQKSRYRKQIALVRGLQTLPNVLDMHYSQQPLPRLLADVDVLITPSSGTASEALLMGVPVVFFDPDPGVRSELKKAYSGDIAAGLVRFWDGADDDIEAIFAELVNSSGMGRGAGHSEHSSAVDAVLDVLSDREQPRS